MQFITYLLATIGYTAISYKLLHKEKHLVSLLKTIISSLISINIACIGFLNLVLKLPDVFSQKWYTPTNSILYLAIAISIGCAYALSCSLLGKVLNKGIISTADYVVGVKAVVINILSVIFLSIGVILVIFPRWFTGYFGKITPEQFMFNLKSPIVGASSDSMVEIFTNPVFKILLTVVIVVSVVNLIYKGLLSDASNVKNVARAAKCRVIVLVLSIFVAISGAVYGVIELNIYDLITAVFNDSSYIEENYVDPRDAKMSFPKKKKNLIHIYLESMENSYLSKDLGGHMDENLMPELTELAKEGISFSHNDKFGGPRQSYGSSWSVAGMINMGAGVPLKTPLDSNSYGLNGDFLPGIITIGDILEAEGYNQTIMFGADADYGGLTTYFNTHGNFKIFDYKYAKEQKLFPSDYYQWWGFEDDKLYDYAKQEITRLANEGKPFNFTMETADTHFPDGYMSPGVENKFDKQYANVIAYSTKEAVEFVRWIQSQPFYEDTVIVVTGDHLSMDKNFFLDFDKDYDRTIFNLILNSGLESNYTKNREFAPFDMFPTILRSMGMEIEGNKLGLGTDLFSGDKTLIERDGLYDMDVNFNAHSQFFLDKFIDKNGTSVFENSNITYKSN